VLLPFMITYDDELVGQLTVNNVVRGALRSAQIGYWVDEGHANRGITTTAVAMATDHCFGPGRAAPGRGRHPPRERAQPPGRREARLPREGLYVRYLDIDGGWRDHVSYALTVEDVPDGLLRRLRERSA
jgi:ribosomal-protein-alanine N-acetyltransferase